MSLLAESAAQMEDWCFSAVFKGARQVFASVRSHHANMNLWPLVHTMPEGRAPQQFFEEVSEDAEFAAGACDL